MTIAEKIKKIGGKADWSAPRGRRRVFAEDLTYLGEVRDHHGGVSKVFSHPLGELVADRHTLLDGRDVLPDDRPYTQSDVGQDRVYQVFAWQAPGWYERVVNAPSSPTPQPKAQRLLDALAGSPILDRQVEIVVAAPASSVGLATKSEMPAIRPTRRIRGAQAILDQLAKKQITVRLATDGASLTTSGAGGNGRGVADLIEKAHPLLVAHLRDGVATCTVRLHEPPVEATDVVVGRALACEDCMAGGAS